MSRPVKTTSAGLLADLVTLVNAPLATPEMKRQALNHAYEIGKLDGRMEGAKVMGDAMLASLAKSS